MRLGMVGLGQMGLNMVRRLMAHKLEVVVYDADPQAVAQAAEDGAIPATSLDSLVAQLTDGPRVVWVMVPPGEPSRRTLESLAVLMQEGDILVDGGDSNYSESADRATLLRYKGVHFLDVGVSSIPGGESGYNLMVGGDEEAFWQVESIFQALAPEGGYRRVGPAGAGHFVKMVLNGVLYGMLQALCEGFEVLRAKEEFVLDLAALAELWQNGSSIRSALLGTIGRALAEDPNMDWATPETGELVGGRDVLLEAITMNIPIPVTTQAMLARLRSRQEESFSAKLLSAVREQFGGCAG